MKGDNYPPSLYPMNFVNPDAYMNICQCSVSDIKRIREASQNAQIQTLTNEINVEMLTAKQNCITDIFRKPKKKLTIYDLNRLIFPFDPIRDWVEKKTKEINEKYAWAEEL